jgi:hypothetical protein
MLLVLLLVLLASCSKESDIVIPEPEPKPPIVFTELDVDLSLSTPDVFTTRANLSETDEGKVSDVTVLVFEHGNTGTLLYVRDVTDLKLVNGLWSFKTKLQITNVNNADHPTDIWLLANLGSKTFSYPIGATKEAIAETLVLTESDGATQVKVTPHVAPADAAIPIPMWGVLSNVAVVPVADSPSAGTLYKSTDTGTPTNVEVDPVSLVRMVSKITVILDHGTNTQGLSLSEVLLYNRNQSGLLVPESAYQSETLSIPSLPQSASRSADSVKYLPNATGDTVTNTIYAFEARNGAPIAFENEPCLVIGILKNSVVEYHRVSLVGKEKDSSAAVAKLHLWRNNQYTIKITSLLTTGWSTPGDALHSATETIQASVLEWTDQEIVVDE